MNVGRYKVSGIHTGFLSLDGGAMFGTIPKVLWERKMQPDSKNRIRLAMRAMLVQGDGKNILVDCGLGDKGGEKFIEMFDVDQQSYSLEKSLQAKGLTFNDISDVVLTHLHFDHAGQATYKDERGQYHLTFPKATYHVQKDNLDQAKNPSLRERASYLKEIYEALEQNHCLNVVHGPMELFKDFELFVSFGHTQSQQHPIVHGDDFSLFYCADLIPTVHHVSLPWLMGYDLHPLQLMDEKKRIYERALKENWYLFFEHDPKISYCSLKMKDQQVSVNEGFDVCD